MKKFISALMAAVLLMVNGFSVVFAVEAELFNDLSVEMVDGGSIEQFDLDGADPRILLKVSFNDVEGLASSSGSYKVFRGDVLEDELASWSNGRAVEASYIFDGKGCNSVGNNERCLNGDYRLVGEVSYSDGGEVFEDSFSKSFSIINGQDEANSALAVDSFSVSTNDGDSDFDPADGAQNETLTMVYRTSGSPDSVAVKIFDGNDKQVVSLNGAANDTVTWDGELGEDQWVVEGNYRAEVVLQKSGQSDVSESVNFRVRYENENAPGFNSINLEKSSFDPDSESTTLRFTNVKDAVLRVDVRDFSGTVIRTFDGFRGRDEDDYTDSTDHNILWNGEANGGRNVAVGAYSFVMVARNEYGARESVVAVRIDDEANLAASTNAHIKGFSCSPSNNFEPADDDDLECEFDSKEDDMDIEIFAVKAGESDILLYDEQGLDKSKDEEFSWDGRDDDDEFVEEGKWIIQIRSRVGNQSLIAEKEIDVEYERPKIDDFLLSKKKIDNELGEVAYALVKMNKKGVLDLTYYLDGDEDDEIVEEYDFEDDVWYAFEVDGSDYDYDEDLDIHLAVYNEAQENSRDTEKESLRLSEEDEDDKANLSNDFMNPVVSECADGDVLELNYTLLNPADRIVAEIKRGANGSGTTVVEVLDLEDQDAGDYSVEFDCLDKNGKKLSKGVYSYKITARDGRSDTEVGVFVVGELGDIDGSASGNGSSRSDSSSSNSNSSGNVASGVKINGVSVDGDTSKDSNNNSKETQCGSFSDLLASSSYCEGVLWASGKGIVSGYPDGSMRVSTPMNRVEMLKVVLEAGGLGTEAASGNLGFSDTEAGAWYIPYLRRALSLGIAKGDGGRNTFRPGDFVNRAEALKLVLELARSKGYSFKNGSAYNDVRNSDWFYQYAVAARAENLLDVGNSLNPSRSATRGEVIEMLYRLNLAGAI